MFMKNNLKLLILMLAIGFVFISLDVDVVTPFKYPNEYANSSDAIGEFQYYNIASNYNAWCDYKVINTDSGISENNSQNTAENNTLSSNAAENSVKVIDKIYFGNISVDIFSDALGLILIFIACFFLSKSVERFKLGMFSSICALFLHILILILPFFLNGMVLCNTVMILGLVYLGSILATTLLFSNGLLSMCKDVSCRDERKWCKMIWYVTFILQILVTFVFWIGADFGMLLTVGRFLEGVLVFMVILFWIVLKRAYYQIEESFLNP